MNLNIISPDNSDNVENHILATIYNMTTDIFLYNIILSPDPFDNTYTFRTHTYGLHPTLGLQLELNTKMKRI